MGLTEQTSHESHVLSKECFHRVKNNNLFWNSWRSFTFTRRTYLLCLLNTRRLNNEKSVSRITLRSLDYRKNSSKR